MKKNNRIKRPAGKKLSKQSVRIKSAVKAGKDFIPFHEAVKRNMI